MIVFGEHDQNTLDQMANVQQTCERAALMADGHLGYTMPIGGVAAYKQQISVVGVGFDIACGNCAIKTDLHTDGDGGGSYWDEIADEIFDAFSFGVGGENKHPKAPREHSLFTADSWSLIPEKHRPSLWGKARQQLGTIGSGNHYIDVFEDEEGWVWVGVHFGSRGFGHKIASAFLAMGQGLPWDGRGKEQENLLHLDNPIGHDYWHLMELAGCYAYAGRNWAAETVVDLLGGRAVDIVHNNHNFAWKENHFGTNYVVVRKGATPAWPGQRGFIGGSMGDDAVIVQGATGLQDQELFQQKSALYSTVHGAGRVMSRTEAKGKWRKGEQRTRGRVTHGEMTSWLNERGVILRGGDLDEAPQAYRRLPDVLSAQGSTIEVLHTLTPKVVCMAQRRGRR